MVATHPLGFSTEPTALPCTSTSAEFPRVSKCLQFSTFFRVWPTPTKRQKASSTKNSCTTGRPDRPTCRYTEPNCQEPESRPIEQSLVVNLSNKILTPLEEQVLNKGLGFVMPNHGDPFTFQCELSPFFRKLRLHYLFKDQINADCDTNTGLRPKSKFQPPIHTVPPQVLAFEQAVAGDIASLWSTTVRSFNNLTKSEQMTLKSLSEDHLITIKPADKGGPIVILNTTDYQTECYRQLNNRQAYSPLSTDPTEEVTKQIQDMVEEALSEGWITQSEATYLVAKHPTTPYFYLLPKVHKPQRPPPGRPIISGIGSLLEPLSTFVDYFLRPIVQKMPTYLQDTKDVLRVLPEIDYDIERDLLVSFDVESLYTSIPQDETLEVVTSILRDSICETITPVPFIMALATIAMKMNFFKYEDKLFLQISGTSMGSVFAPSLANLYVHQFEQQRVLTPTNPFHTSIRWWKRYIDDVLVVWRGTVDSVNEFHQWLNSRNQFLKFTMETNKERIAFLDLSIYVTTAGLQSELYKKPMARNSLLLYESYHPKSLRQHLPYGQFLRVRRNCSNREDFEVHARNLCGQLRDRHFPNSLIKRSKKRAVNSNREALLEAPIPKPPLTRLTFVSTFNTRSNAIQKIVKRHWCLLNHGREKIVQPLFAFKRASSIRDRLVHTRPKELPRKLGPPRPSHYSRRTSQAQTRNNLGTKTAGNLAVTLKLMTKLPHNNNCQSKHGSMQHIQARVSNKRHNRQVAVPQNSWTETLRATAQERKERRQIARDQNRRNQAQGCRRLSNFQLQPHTNSRGSNESRRKAKPQCAANKSRIWKAQQITHEYFKALNEGEIE
ncbi:uncharacterized protein LOC144765749 [Lissotriton helveticus]